MEKRLIREQVPSSFMRILVSVFLLMVFLGNWLGLSGAEENAIRMQSSYVLEGLALFSLATFFVRFPGMGGRLFMFCVDLLGLGYIFFITSKQTHLLIYSMPLIFFAHAIKMERPDLIAATILALCFDIIVIFQKGLSVSTWEIFGLNCFAIICLGIIADLIKMALMQKTAQRMFIKADQRAHDLQEELNKIRSKFDAETIFDPVTSLYNFRFFKKRLDEEISRASREREELTLVLVGIDRFQVFNQVYGREEGDRTLKKIGDLLIRYVRETDLVARYMEDQFFALLPNTGPKNSLYPVLRIRNGISRARISPDGRYNLTVCIGAATYPYDSKESTELIQKASAALRRSKEKGPSKVTQFAAMSGGKKA